MGLSEKEKFEIRKVIKANKWYTFEEAESDLRKHWQPENDKNGDYLSMKRSQIQKILRSDILGTYLEINKRKKECHEKFNKRGTYKSSRWKWRIFNFSV